MPRRGRIGVGRASAAPRFTEKAEEMKAVSLQSAMDTVQKLETKLADFAKKHKHEIQTDPAFRAKFLQMCAPLGVDPLSSKKGFWEKVGLGIGEFYYELAVKVAEVCLASRSRNGGIISVSEVRRILMKRGTKFKLSSSTGGKVDKYSRDDIITAVEKLSKLGSGFRTVHVGNTVMIVSVPTELNNDHMEVMRIANEDGPNKGRVTVIDVQRGTGWTEDRVRRALDLLLSEGMAWIDIQKGKKSFFWFPSVWKEGFDSFESEE